MTRTRKIIARTKAFYKWRDVMENSNVSSTGELIVEINYEQTEIPTVIREESSLLSTDALKLRK